MSIATTPALLRNVDGRDLPVAGTYEIDSAHSTVGFVARHLVVSKTRGEFTDVTGTVNITDDPADSSVTATIEASSFSTGNADRDAHITSADFLDVENHPTITFVSTGLVQKGDDFALTGDLTIRGVSRPVSLTVEFDGVAVDPWGGSRTAFTAVGEIDREAWGITWNQALDTGGVLVSKKIAIELSVQAVRA